MGALSDHDMVEELDLEKLGRFAHLARHAVNRGNPRELLA
jgi:hypothetical protein